MSASPWNNFEDSYVIPSTGLLLCKCQKICHGLGQVPHRTWSHHHSETEMVNNSKSSRRAVPAKVTTNNSGPSKQSRLRSDSDEIADAGGIELQRQSLAMDIDETRDNAIPDSITEPPPPPNKPLTPVPPFGQTDDSLDPMDELSDGEGLNFDTLSLPNNSDSESDDDRNGPEEQEQRQRAESPLSRPVSPAPLLLGPAPGTKFSPRPPWQSIPRASVKIEKLNVSLDFIEALETACKASTQLSAADNERLWNPPRERLDTSDPGLCQALRTFMGADAPVTEETFNALCDSTLECHPNAPFPSFYKAKRKLEELTGVSTNETDMCPSSCITYTGPFAKLNKCPYPKCGEPRYDQAKLQHGVCVARAKFWTIPIGPYIQVLWRHLETAEELKHHHKHHGTPSKAESEHWEDIFHGSDYAKLVRDGVIKPNDMLLLFSIDSAQLYAHKASDCWIYIWVILDLRPRLRYKKFVEICRIGNLILYAQWTLERTIGNLGGEIRQPKHMYANLSQRGVYRVQLNAIKAMDPTLDQTAKEVVPTGGRDIGDGYQLLPRQDHIARPLETTSEFEALKSYLSGAWGVPYDDEQHNSCVKCWACLILPESGQVSRSQFRESEDNRVACMVKMPEGFEIGEVLYFFRYNVQDNTLTALAMVSVFGVPDRVVLKDSFGTLWAAHSELGGSDIKIFSLSLHTTMYRSGSGANPLLMQAFRGSGSGSSGGGSSRSSPFPTPNPLAFLHTHSFSNSSHHTVAHLTLSSPGLGYASLNDDDMLSLSSPIPTGFPDLYPVPATNNSESSEILLTRVDGLGRDLNFMQGEIWGLRSMLESVLEVTCNPTNEAPWIRLASDVFHGQTPILAKSPQLVDSALRTKIKKSAGGTNKKNNVNNEGQYIEHADGTVVGGIEFGQVRECANHLFFDLLAAGWATRKLAHIGEHRSASFKTTIKFWAAPFRGRLILYDAPVPGTPPPGPPPPGAPPPLPPAALMAHKCAADDSADSERAKKRQELLNDFLLTQIPPPSERVPLPNTKPDTLLADVEQSTVPLLNTEPNTLLADVEQSTVWPPNTEPNTLLVNVEQSTDVVPNAGGADGAPPVQPDMFDDIVVEPPPAPPASTPGSAPAPPPPPPVMTSRVLKGKLCMPHSKHFTARNLHLAVYCVDVPCSEAEYKIEWSCLQSEDAARVKKYANTLKDSKPKPTEIPMATVIRKCIEELLAEQNI
ncbi:hypothetical protein B0H14DRAFT_3876438 [Mycena olivaceomarginata]|nr:hypothetical protein B0H14DRAFT_3876438 [Mycena olivaceomarginata]